MSTNPKVLMVVLDAAEASLVERWIEEGTLPNLARLRERGAFGRLESTAAVMNASAWPSFHTGLHAMQHGITNYLLWSQQRMDYVRPDRLEIPGRPFWRRLQAAGVRTVAIDIPYAFPDEDHSGFELNGWAGHYKLTPTYTSPRSRLAVLEHEFGTSPIDSYRPGDLAAREFLAVRDLLIDGTARVARLGSALLEREPWDLFVLGLGTTHTAGHQLWDATNVTTALDDKERTELRGALKAVYVAADEAAGQFVAAAGEGVTTVVCALHGMGANQSKSPLLPEMLRRVLEDTSEPAPASGRSALKKVRELVPNRLRSAVKSRLPVSLQDRLTLFWRREGRLDWPATRAFCLFPDKEGFIRVNLKGRESEGIVEPGADYEELCGQIADGLSSFVSPESGRPAARIAHVDDLCAGHPDAPRELLPDLVVYWDDQPCAETAGVTSPRYGTVPWPRPGFVLDGQSGHHRPDGWLIAAGPNVRSGGEIEGFHVLDLAPTAVRLFGQEPPEWMQGRVIPALLGEA